MHVTVAGKQVETGEALQTHVREGLATITQKYFDDALEANVTFRRDVKGKAGAFACDINLKAGRNLFMRARAKGWTRIAPSRRRRSTSPSGCGATGGG